MNELINYLQSVYGAQLVEIRVHVAKDGTVSFQGVIKP